MQEELQRRRKAMLAAYHDIAASDGGMSENDIADRLLAAAQPDSPSVAPQYTSEMGQAAQDYIESCCRSPSGKIVFHPPAMPGGFLWERLYNAMLAASPQALMPPMPQGLDHFLSAEVASLLQRDT